MDNSKLKTQNSKLPVGVDASRLAVGQRTGTENYALQVTLGLRRLARQEGRTLRLYFNQAPSPQVLQLLEPGPGLELCVIPFPRLWTHLRLSRELRQHPPESLFVPAHVLPVLHPARSVVTIHDLGYFYFPQAHTNKARLYLDWSTRYSATQARSVIAISQATKADLVRHYGIDPAKISVIYHGFDWERFRPLEDKAAGQAARQRYGIGPGRFLLYVGTLQPRKNLLRLLDAFERLATGPELADVQLVLAGRPGWLSDEIISQARKLQALLPGRVMLPGYLADEDLPILLNEAAAFVFPSLYEGFGMPVLEALACGCPVVCSNSSSLPEVAGPAALYHHPLDTEALLYQLKRLLTRPALAADLRQRGFEQAAKFSWERCTEQTWQIIKNL